MTKHVYGRGKFVAHPEYINYMEEIVAHQHYQGMPNSRNSEGRINWQVSSGKTTSFYKDYLARRDWWIKKADSLNLPGKNDENDRFTVAARLIHPTGYRVCRLCGERSNVGYFYFNHLFTRKLNLMYSPLAFEKGQSIGVLIRHLDERHFTDEEKPKILLAFFPERADAFEQFGYTVKAFEKTSHVRTRWLSPGFMGNPPDRLDGFHDYDLACRKANDPGRSDANMRTYNHDRRSFEWWAEGNWALADALYNSAGSGKCSVHGCKEVLDRVSPDHVGPLACGFKQLPLFSPTCQKHNSAKNRRFSLLDVGILLKYEATTGESVASWQVRSHWDKYKSIVQDDRQTKALSNSLRSLQDFYLRTLWEVARVGRVRLLASLLHPEFALQDFQFIGLDASNLTFERIHITQAQSMMRMRLAARTVRIAFEALSEYASKPSEKRKMVRADFDDNVESVNALLNTLSDGLDDEDIVWQAAIATSDEEAEIKIAKLLVQGAVPIRAGDLHARKLLMNLFDQVGTSASVDFSRYDDTFSV